MGRVVFDSLRKAAVYLLPAGSYTEVMAVFFSVLLGMQIPTTTYQQVCFCITNDVVMSMWDVWRRDQYSSLVMESPQRQTGYCAAVPLADSENKSCTYILIEL